MKCTPDSNKSNIKQVITAAVAISIFMLVFGAGYRMYAAQLNVSSTLPAMPVGALDKLPFQIGTWQGQDKPLDEATVKATDTDAHISRNYSRPGIASNVWLYVACGVNARDLMPHRPEVCYTGNGWRLDDRKVKKLPLSDGTELPCNIFQFTRGSVGKDRLLVLYYYIVDGQYCHDVSLLRSKAWRGSGTVRYVAQVEMVIPILADIPLDSTVNTITGFASESALLIADLFK